MGYIEVEKVCIICQEARVSDNDICAECWEKWAVEIEREPPPAWLIEAQRSEHAWRKSERTALRQEIEERTDDPTELDRLNAPERDNPAVQQPPDIGTFTSFREARAFLDKYQAAHPGYWSEPERKAVEWNLMAIYLEDYGNEDGNLDIPLTWDRRLNIFNGTETEFGRPSISKSRLRAITKSGMDKLRAIGWRRRL